MALVLFASLLAAVPAGFPLGLGPSEASAQGSAGSAVLHRTSIVEGQTRDFEISGIASRPRYFLHFSVAGSFSAEAGDITASTNDLLGRALAIIPDRDGPRAYPDAVYKRIRFEVTANSDSARAAASTPRPAAPRYRWAEPACSHTACETATSIELDTRIPSGHRICLKIDGPGMLDWMTGDSLRPWWDIVFGRRPPPEGEATAGEAADMATAVSRQAQ
ncbi:hypothetical protein [Candidatus Poriferisocius sp.]|uniref:hypothetical protein n=1 Tax=Candidatus Poriferisocius sp. TaxID=3101276 RepID=UPI003B59E761